MIAEAGACRDVPTTGLELIGAGSRIPIAAAPSATQPKAVIGELRGFIVTSRDSRIPKYRLSFPGPKAKLRRLNFPVILRINSRDAAALLAVPGGEGPAIRPGTEGGSDVLLEAALKRLVTAKGNVQKRKGRPFGRPLPRITMT